MNFESSFTEFLGEIRFVTTLICTHCPAKQCGGKNCQLPCEWCEGCRGGERGQGLPRPGQPAIEVGRAGKAARQQPLQDGRGLKRELPAAPPGQPATGGAHRPQLGMGDRIEGADHFDQAGGTQPHLDKRGRQSRKVTSPTH